MSKARPTVRSIAAKLGVSRSTVSNALRGRSGVKAETRLRVRKEADASGYSTHPFAAQVMSQLRRGSLAEHVGTLAVLEREESQRPPGARNFNRDILEGVKERAAAMGFAVTHQRFGPPGDLSLKRLDQILHWRGIQGLVLMPAWSEPDFRDLDWSRYTGVYVDYLLKKPALHTVCSDHFRTLFDALEKARELGYRRVGFAVARRANERLNGRWIGAYLGYLHDHPEMDPLAPLVEEEIGAENFLPWFRAQRPEVVITHWVGAFDQMIAAGADIPRRHGLICLNLLPAPSHFSGFSLQPRVLGMRAAELVVAQLSYRDRGIPTIATTMLVPSRWVNGSTIRLP